MDMRLEPRDAIEHVAHRFDRGELAAAEGVEQRDGAHFMGTHGVSIGVERPGGWGPSPYFQESAERSLAKIGAFFQTPFRLASAMTTFGSWNRNALTQSSASLCCASTSAFL